MRSEDEIKKMIERHKIEESEFPEDNLKGIQLVQYSATVASLKALEWVLGKEFKDW